MTVVGTGFGSASGFGGASGASGALCQPVGLAPRVLCTIGAHPFSHTGTATPLAIAKDACVLWCELMPVLAVGFGEVDGCWAGRSDGVLSSRRRSYMVRVDAARSGAHKVVKLLPFRNRPDHLFIDPSVGHRQASPTSLGAKCSVPPVPESAGPHPTVGVGINFGVRHEALHRRPLRVYAGHNDSLSVGRW